MHVCKQYSDEVARGDGRHADLERAFYVEERSEVYHVGKLPLNRDSDRAHRGVKGLLVAGETAAFVVDLELGSKNVRGITVDAVGSIVIAKYATKTLYNSALVQQVHVVASPDNRAVEVDERSIGCHDPWYLRACFRLRPF